MHRHRLANRGKDNRAVGEPARDSGSPKDIRPLESGITKARKSSPTTCALLGYGQHIAHYCQVLSKSASLIATSGLTVLGCGYSWPSAADASLTNGVHSSPARMLQKPGTAHLIGYNCIASDFTNLRCYNFLYFFILYHTDWGRNQANSTAKLFIRPRAPAEIHYLGPQSLPESILSILSNIADERRP